MIPGVVASAYARTGGSGPGPAPADDPYWDDVVSLLHFEGNAGSNLVFDAKGGVWSVGGSAQLTSADAIYGLTSMAFNGTTGSKITRSLSTHTELNTEDFTIEFTINRDNLDSATVFDTRSATGTQTGMLVSFPGANPAGLAAYFGNGGANWEVSLTPADEMVVGVSYHVAITREGDTFRMFLDGVKIAEATAASPLTINNTLTAVNFGGNLNGTASVGTHMKADEFRITKNVARYTANFTPPSGPFPGIGLADADWAYVGSLLHFNGADNTATFLDETGKSWSGSAGTVISNTDAKFGQSLQLDGSAKFISTGWSEDFSIEGDFTVECFVRLNSVKRHVFASCYPGAASGFVFDTGPSNELRLILATGAYDILTSGANVLPINDWVHVAGVRQGSTFMLFIDGLKRGEAAVARPAVDSGGTFYVGRDPLDASRDVNGRMDEFRFSRVARYTSDFTPPDAPFPSNEAPPAQSFAFDPANKYVSVVLSNEDKTASVESGVHYYALCDTPKQAGQWMFELLVDSADSAGNISIGIDRQAGPYTSSTYPSSYGGMYFSRISSQLARLYYSSGSGSYTPQTVPDEVVVPGDRITIAVDFDADTFAAYKNGILVHSRSVTSDLSAEGYVPSIKIGGSAGVPTAISIPDEIMYPVAGFLPWTP